jgi:putative ABC transport system permease protein
MIKNYFKLGFRNLAKNRLSSSINILGLALAVACCLVVF